MGRIARCTLLMVLAPLILLGHTAVETPGKEKIELLNLKAVQCYKNKSYEKCITFARQALEASTGTGDLNGKIEASSLLICGYLCTHQKKKASKFIEQTVKLCKENGKEEELADFYILLGRAYRSRLHKPVPAIKYILKAQRICLKTGNKFKTACSANLLGAVYWDISQYDKALHYYFQALKIFEEINDKMELSPDRTKFLPTTLMLHPHVLAAAVYPASYWQPW